MATINTNALANDIRTLYAALRATADTINADTAYSAEGKRQQWNNIATKYAPKLAELETKVNQLLPALDAHTTSLEDEYINPSTIPTSQRVVAELAAARTLNRGSISYNDAKARIERMAIEGTAEYADVILNQEAIMTGALDMATFRALLAEASSLYGEAIKQRPYLEAAINNYFKQWLNASRRLLSDVNTPDSYPETSIPAIEAITGAVGFTLQVPA
ncbi:hypothetical protein [Corynebacterium epidermidicanis]|uniref:Uncharacterized protein n=1 Tax=Corynebacterium epidermidicanis TaxID=1050174 RepID=A0A0G3GPH4_9CORY|nr:hypothetical protein [Corynebacterium epidermidicanis]AKK03069.1 hypothetical protein CEPID_06040 [Corynebacterium epidermidicanis]